MNHILRRFTLVTAVILLSWGAVSAQTAPNSKDLPNFYKVNARLYRGGQPTEAGIKELKRLGVKTVIDLRNNDDRARREGGWARAQGLKFINIPLNNWFGPHKTDIDAILRQIDIEGDQPVFVHCSRGSDRTGTVVAIYRITHNGWNDKRANAEAKEFGFGWWQVWMKDYIGDYYREYARTH